MEISKEYSVNLSNEFEKVLGERFVLYGASSGGVSCYKYLQQKGISDQVECFVDSDRSKHGKSLCGKEIRSIDFLKDNPSFIVIVSSVFFSSVYESICKADCKNIIYAHVPAGPPFADNDFARGAQMIESFYDENDEYSKMIIRSLFWLKDKSNIRIQPIENVMALSQVASYWYEGKTNLEIYDMLTIFDVGAFDGDTLRELSARYGSRIKKYHAFEPDRLTVNKLHNTARVLKIEDIVEIHSVGLGDENTVLNFCASGDFTYTHHISENGETVVNIKRLDDMKLTVIGKPCVKMDVEGYEMKALAGAGQFIYRYEPELAICVYHKVDDIFRIPEFIKSINPKYRCILRGGLHMVCYATTGRH